LTDSSLLQGTPRLAFPLTSLFTRTPVSSGQSRLRIPRLPGNKATWLRITAVIRPLVIFTIGPSVVQRSVASVAIDTYCSLLLRKEEEKLVGQALDPGQERKIL